MDVICIDVMLYTILVYRWAQLVVAIVNICKFVDLGSIQYMGGAVEFFLTFKFNYIIIRIKLCRCIERNL